MIERIPMEIVFDDNFVFLFAYDFSMPAVFSGDSLIDSSFLKVVSIVVERISIIVDKVEKYKVNKRTMNVAKNTERCH